MNRFEKALNSNRSSWMRVAISLASENVRLGKGGPFGAIIVKDGIAVGHGSNSVTRKNDPTAHAEVEAIRNACKNLGTFNLEGCEIYTSCEPCPMCLSSCYWARLDRIYYGNTASDAAEIEFDDAFIYKELRKKIESRKLPSIQLLSREAKSSFREWKKSQIKIKY